MLAVIKAQMEGISMSKKKTEAYSNIGQPVDTRIRTVSKGVNLKTMEGSRDIFDSFEDIDAYFTALEAEDYDNEI
jgi:hypothetical protein